MLCMYWLIVVVHETIETECIQWEKIDRLNWAHQCTKFKLALWYSKYRIPLRLPVTHPDLQLRWGGFVLLALPAFLPSFYLLLPKIRGGGWVRAPQASPLDPPLDTINVWNWNMTSTNVQLLPICRLLLRTTRSNKHCKSIVRNATSKCMVLLGSFNSFK